MSATFDAYQLRARVEPVLLAAVPVALATDDEGVSRSNMTDEFVRAAEDYKLSYRQLKNMVRNSLHLSFLPGASLWQGDDYGRLAAACATDFKASSACANFLESTPRAREEWKLEESLGTFEKQSINLAPSLP